MSLRIKSLETTGNTHIKMGPINYHLRGVNVIKGFVTIVGHHKKDYFINFAFFYSVEKSLQSKQ